LTVGVLISGTGAAFIFHWNQNAFQEVASLSAAPNPSDDFGISVVISSDGEIIVAGGIGTVAQQSAYIFEKQSNNSWTPTRVTEPAMAALNNQFGYSVAVWNGTVAVGAPRGDALGTDRGNVYIYQKNGETWSPLTRGASNGNNNDYFGGSVAIGDGTVVVGAKDFDSPGI